ncbi:class I SAM-dependent DNA methyltransferase [Pontibacillus yanchengensis]|uniref:Methyltransferase n=1 Tax=Pontibacillus yanchengensis Y32 TaxID=1385514 RepID=A0A0A2TAF4_9BACI|nr:class I SAM-dependent methyltransferase [Pontibacillus yanchengensis]KGP71071.1 methyltransferase [Pontibacillus yanchengensis Y32]
MGLFVSQFTKPKGLIGKVVGWFMYRENAKISKWTLSFLNIQPNEHVLEIGFGPGYCIRKLSKNVEHILISGVDPSKAMVEQAKKRNEKGVKKGWIQLDNLKADELSSFSTPLDKVIAINNITYWENPVEVLKTIKENMNHEGKIAITLQPHEKGAMDDTTENASGQIQAFMEEAGFRHIRIHLRPGKPTKTACVVGMR